MKQQLVTLALCWILSIACIVPAQGAIYITEYLYSGNSGEFIEFTNVGTSSIDMTGWSYDDNSQTAGSFDLSAFGVLAAGESVILTEAPEADFRTAWSMDPTVKIIGGLTVNLGRNDEINVFDAAANLVDRLTFGDQNIAGSIRAQNFSGSPVSPSALGANDILQWGLSSLGDAQSSFSSAAGEIGNPGSFSVVPEPTSCMLLACVGLAGVLVRRRAR